MKEFMQSHQNGKIEISKLIQKDSMKGLPVSVFGRTWADRRAGKLTYQIAGSKYIGNNGNYVGTTGNNRFQEKVIAITGFPL